MSQLKMKRIYEPAEPTDGVRILVDRLWPRGHQQREGGSDALGEGNYTFTGAQKVVRA